MFFWKKIKNATGVNLSFKKIEKFEIPTEKDNFNKKISTSYVPEDGFLCKLFL